MGPVRDSRICQKDGVFPLALYAFKQNINIRSREVRETRYRNDRAAARAMLFFRTHVVLLTEMNAVALGMAGSEFSLCASSARVPCVVPVLSAPDPGIARLRL